MLQYKSDKWLNRAIKEEREKHKLSDMKGKDKLRRRFARSIIKAAIRKERLQKVVKGAVERNPHLHRRPVWQ